MSKQKILLYGISGMVGSRIGQILGDKFKIIAPPHSHLDVTNQKLVHQNITDVRPDKIIYAAGITKVDYAQTHPKETFLLNAQAARYICQKAATFNIPVIYISTDAVFDGKSNRRPYVEEDKPNPISVYGKSKLEGEKITLSASGQNCVLRTIMVYSANFPHKKDFARLAYENLARQEKFEGIVDQVINPTFVDDLVWAIAAICARKSRGIYHVAATDFTTNYGFVEKIAQTFEFDKRLITKVKFANFFKDKPAPRCRYCWLDTAKFQKEFGKKILHNLDQGLALFKKQIERLEPQPVDL